MYIYYARTHMLEKNPFWITVRPGICQYRRPLKFCQIQHVLQSYETYEKP